MLCYLFDIRSSAQRRGLLLGAVFGRGKTHPVPKHGCGILRSGSNGDAVIKLLCGASTKGSHPV
ncbi:MAG: hypothetical protein ACR2M4_01750 [Actinomycetota bacterium]